MARQLSFHWPHRVDFGADAYFVTDANRAAFDLVRDPARWRPVCKHAYAVLEKSSKFFVRPEKSPLRKLGSRFSVDSPEAIEVQLCDDNMTARVAQKAVERELIRRVARRYVEKEDS